MIHSPQLGVKHKTLKVLFGLALALTLAPTDAQARVSLNPQTVVNLTLKQGLQAKAAAFQAQRAYLPYEQALGVLDFQLTFTPGYTYDQARNLTLTNDLLDRTLVYDTVLAKKLRSGTSISIEYFKEQQASVLNASTSTSTFRTPNENWIWGQVQVQQELWRNSFGFADRLAIEIGQRTIDAALQTREDSLQTIILNNMTLFWNVYTAEQVLQEDLGAQKTYEELLVNVRRKAGYSLAQPAELSQLEASLMGADEAVKNASVTYLSAVDQLLSALQIKGNEEVTISVP